MTHCKENRTVEAVFQTAPIGLLFRVLITNVTIGKVERGKSITITKITTTTIITIATVIITIIRGAISNIIIVVIIMIVVIDILTVVYCKS